jgi:PAS domain S-box-containing protein
MPATPSKDFSALIYRAPAFDALGRAPARRRSASWLPFVAIAALVAFSAALFVAIVTEDRQLQREARQRDFDSAAQQLGARLGSLTEALSATALELGAETISDRRFASIVGDLGTAKPELKRVDRVDAAGRIVSPGPESPTAGVQIDAGYQPLLAKTRLSSTPQWDKLTASNGEPQLALAVPILRDRQLVGVVLARVDPRGLLINGLTAETRQRYQFRLVSQGNELATSGTDAPPAKASIYAATLAPLPPGIQLEARAFRLPSRLTGSALVWVVGVLAVAVGAALAALLRYTTQLLRADRVLQAETSLRSAMENSLATGLSVVDSLGVIRYVNKAFAQMSGWSDAELVGRGAPYPYWPPDQSQEHANQLERMLEGKIDAAGFEARVQRPDGSRFDARMYVSPLVDDAGVQIGWVTSMTDITEPRRIRDALAAAHDRFTTVLESLDDVVSVVAGEIPDAELLFANRAYREAFGSDTAGHTRLAAQLPDGSGGEQAGEVQDLGSSRWYDVRMREIRWVDGRAVRLQIATDITLRKATAEIVRQQEEKVQLTSRLMTMGEMASSLAHELNQPLTAISNYSEGALARLRRDTPATAISPEVMTALEKASTQAQRAGNIIRRIREFVKRSEPRRRATPAARIIEDAVGFAEIDARKKGIRIITRVDPSLTPLDVDPILIEQVLLNLLKNALEAMDHATLRQIDVDARATADGMAQITVTDRGTGIPAAHLASLFQPFFSTKSEGMGMGLNICRSIIEFHQGRLTVEPNPEPSGGTIMRFTLPLATSDSRPHNSEASDGGMSV